MRILITGGGTGGHIYPALAIARGLKERSPDSVVWFAGSANGLEAEIIPREGFIFKSIQAQGLPRKLFRIDKMAQVIWKNSMGGYEAYRLIKEFKPDVVIGTGGYVSFSVVMMAALQGIPTLIQEQNAFPGRANRVLARYVSKIALAFPESADYFVKGASTEVTGLPVRPEILATNRKQGLLAFGLLENKKTLLVVGGSQGAKTINTAMVDFIKLLCQSKKQLQLIHVTGPKGYEQMVSELGKAGLHLDKCPGIVIKPYLHNIHEAMACADFIVCRAGATTIAELTVRGIPAILVPYPYAANNHQEHNAMALVHKGAAQMILDRDLSGEILWKRITDAFEQEEEYQKMMMQSKKIGQPDALHQICSLIEELAKRPK